MIYSILVKPTKVHISTLVKYIVKLSIKYRSNIIFNDTKGNGNMGGNRDKAVKALFTSEVIIREGILADEMYMTTSSKAKARKSEVNNF